MSDKKPTPKLTGPWSIERVEEFLESTVVPVRLSVLGSSGGPIVASHWFTFDEGMIRCAVQKASFVDCALAANGVCGFEIARDDPPYRGVRGQGKASRAPDPDKSLLRLLHDRYLGADETEFRRWLLGRDHEETTILIEPTHWSSWDYADRMQRA